MNEKGFSTKVIFLLLSTILLCTSFAFAQKDVRPDPVGKEAETHSTLSIPYSQTNRVRVWVLNINSKEYTITHNGVTKPQVLNHAPILVQGRTMMPVRTISELMGVELRYNEKTKTAQFIYMTGILEENPKQNIVEFTADKSTMRVNGVEKALSVKPTFADGRVLISLKDIQHAMKELGFPIIVQWNSSTKQIIISE